MRNRKRLVLIGAATALAVAVAPAATAAGHSATASGKKPGWSRTLSTEVLAPFGIAVDGNAVHVAEGATNTVYRLAKGVTSEVGRGLTGPTSDVAGVDVADDGSVAYTTSSTDDTGLVHTASELVIKQAGKPDVHADLLAYENAANPDGDVRYGLQPGAECTAQALEWLDLKTHGAGSYNGIKDTHPYAVASLGNGSWAVADAGANAILKVTATGQVSTLAVLPSQPQTVTPALLASISFSETGEPEPVPEFTSCLLGETYAFEPVPTDVEVGPRGVGAAPAVSTRPPVRARASPPASRARPTWRSLGTAPPTSPSCSAAGSRRSP